MPSTFPSALKTLVEDQPAPTVLRWRIWPLVDHARRSGLVFAGIGVAGSMVGYLSSSWTLAIAAGAGLAATLWQFFVPVRYEIGSLGLRLTALGRTRFVPWHAVLSYQLRSSGILLYPRAEPTKIDLLRSLFIPFPPDADESLCLLRQHLPHAEELSH